MHDSEINGRVIPRLELESVWETLIDQIFCGNVIPVIGNEMVMIGDKTSERILLDRVASEIGIKEKLSSFTALMNHPGCRMPKSVYKYVANQIIENPGLFRPTKLLETFLSNRHFPFVLTMTVDPTVENTMRKIHGEKLRVLSFDNNPCTNDDIANSNDVYEPTLYYMFGKANPVKSNFVLSDADLLRFSRSWLLPSDSSSRSKPANLSNALSDKYLLVLGNHFQDWLFRFFWFAMKDEKLNARTDVPNGMEASSRCDEHIIEFLNFSNIVSQKTDLQKFVTELQDRICKAETEQYPVYVEKGLPIMNADVFISYSREDRTLAEKLCSMLKNRGISVWFDRDNLGIADEFKKEIRHAIRTCSLFVPILSNNIIRQAADEHIYRLEWKWAIEHMWQISSSVAYMAPLTEDGFDIEDRMADIPEEIQKHNAFSCDREGRRLDKFVDVLCELLDSMRR